MPTMQQMQQQLNKDMQEMMNGMKKGKQGGGQEMSKEFARMAQEAGCFARSAPKDEGEYEPKRKVRR